METPARRFTILDGMALVAVVAIGIWLLQANLHTVHVPWSSWEPVRKPLTTAYLAYRSACVLQPFMMVLAALLLLLGFIPPRPRFNVVMRRPGTVACAAIASVAFVRVIKVKVGLTICGLMGESWITFIFGIDFDVKDPFEWLWPIFFAQTEDLVSQTCTAVAASWAILKLSGSWRSESSWLDRTGRGLGIVYFLILFVLLFWFPLPYEWSW